MVNIAILVANSEYRSLGPLSCCHDDVMAMEELLEATEKYAAIERIENENADTLKARIRSLLDQNKNIEELFFYFTGHGYQHVAEFFFCAPNFDRSRPNETGLSSTELHTLLRMSDAQLVIKVVDACNSGTLLVKSDGGFTTQQKEGFKNLIQIASCLESQNSLTGSPLSVFTEKFRAAALRKTDGVVYYTDIIFALRDEFIQNDSQTPHFVSQGTGREQFVENAKRLDGLRAKLANLSPPLQPLALTEPSSSSGPPSLLELLRTFEQKLATAEIMERFIGSFFDRLSDQMSAEEFADFFNLERVEHPDFKEDTTRGFIIRVLSKEKRPDNFVTATITREKQNPRWAAASAAALLGFWGTDQSYMDVYDLQLNCSMKRAQLKITLTPKYASLQRIVLVVTCAPSLEHCYVFEVATQHPLRDFGVFDSEGTEVVRRWYKFLWGDNTDAVVKKITSKLSELLHSHLEETQKRLTSD